MNTKLLCSLAVAGAFALGGAGSALAAPAGPEGPANCSFTGGTTTCANVGAPVVTTSTSSPDQNGCTTTSETTTTTTTYSAHRGTYNSNGTSVAAPANTSTSSTREVSHYCPPPPSNGPGEAACKSLGYNYSGERQGSVYGYAATIHFTCGEGNGLSFTAANQISWTSVHSEGCATRNVSDDWWGTTTGTDGAAYYECYTFEKPYRQV